MNSRLRFTRSGFVGTRVLLVLGIALSSTPAWALKEFYSLSRSPRALGMGGTFYGISDDEHAVFYNPAGLAFRERPSETMVHFKFDGATSIVDVASALASSAGQSVGEVVTNLQSFQGNPVYGSATPLFLSYVRKYFAAGLLLGDTKVNFALLGRDLDSSVDMTLISDSGVFAGFAVPVYEGLAVGLNSKALFRAGGRKEFDVLEMAQGQDFLANPQDLGGLGVGVDFDLGVSYQLPEFARGVKTRASVVMNNLLASRFDLVQLGESTGLPPGLPRMFTVAGYAELPGVWVFEAVRLGVDFAEFGLGGVEEADLGARNGSFWKHVNWGVEVQSANGWLYGRAGLRQGNITLGLGVDARFFKLDIATYAEELALLPGRLTSRRLAARLAFGYAGAAPAVASQTGVTVDPVPPQPVPAPAAQPAGTDGVTPSEKAGAAPGN